MKFRLIASFGLVSLIAVAGPSFADAARFPHDVDEFLANRVACDHFRGEVIDPPDADLKKERNENIATYCTGTDRQLVRLKKKYVRRRDVMKELNALEPKIEASK